MKYICLYAKPPIPGETKSRLAKEIGEVNAAEFAGSMLKDLCAAVLEVTDAVPQLWSPPDCSYAHFQRYAPPEFTMHRQCGQDLGARMSHTFSKLLADTNGETQAIIIGSDCITHDYQSLTTAFTALDSRELVIQPSSDGGYVLVGQSRWHPEVFEDIDWGTSTVLQQTIENGDRAGINYELLSETFDVDTKQDMQILKEYVRGHKRKHVSEWLRTNSNLI